MSGQQGPADLSGDQKRQRLEAALRRRLQAHSDLPLSHNQRALWLLCQLTPESGAYNVAFTARVVSPVDADALRRAFERLVERHASLRCAFPVESGGPVQRVRPSMTVPFEVVDASGWPLQHVYDELTAERSRPFDLLNGPLLRVRLYRQEEGDAFLAIAFHHIIMDGWSLWVCLSELRDLYREARDGAPAASRDAGSSPAAFLRWQAQLVASDAGARSRAFWRERLGGNPAPMNLPADRVRPPVPSGRGGSHRLRMDVPSAARLRTLATDARATLQMGVLALLHVLLHRYTGQDDLVVGYLAGGRSNQQFDSVVGYLVNPLALRTPVRPRSTFREVLRATRDTLLEALDHQDYPFPLVVEEVAPQREAGRPPLFSVLFVFEKPQLLAEANASGFIAGPGERMTLGDLVLESLPLTPQQESHFDLTFLVIDTGGLAISIEYNADLFDEPTIRRMAAHLATLSEAALAQPDRAVSELPILPGSELERLAQVNATASPLPRHCFHHLFEKHAARHPDDVAVAFEDRRVSYGELNRRSNRFARDLRALGVRRDTVVGLCVERCPELIVAMLGILKAGGAFLPLDPGYPADRLAFMIADSQVPVLVAQRALAGRLPEYDGHRVWVEEALAAPPSEDDTRNAAFGQAPRDLCYVIYTSGSTGRPKGVLLEHRGLVNVAIEQQRLFGVGRGARVLQFASLSFDAAVFEVAMALGSGATLHLAPPESLLPGRPLLETIRRGRINVVTLPPSAMLTLPVEELPDLKTVTVAGEACPRELVARWASGRRFFNLYGPTEGTIWSTAVECLDGTRTPTIGGPIGNTEVYVLDAQLQPAPIGVPGELYIGGAGLARGYHNRPELTASRFIRHPFSDDSEARLYRTGDVVRLRADGELEYLGRVDFQVKLRGFRIELGEIEAVLGQHPAVNQAIAAVREDVPGQPRLVAYVTRRGDGDRSPAALKAFLRAQLPEYMVPSAFVFLDAFPTTPAGKIDRRALPAPADWRGAEDAFVQPSGTIEERIARIWCEVLRLDRVGRDESFFDIGGSSLLMADVHARVNEIASTPVSMVEMFQFPTVRALAARIDERRAAAGTDGLDGMVGASAPARGDVLVTGRATLRDLRRRRQADETRVG